MSGLPKGWVEAKIGEVCNYIQRGKSPKYVESSALPVINQKCVRWAGIDERYLKYVDPEQWSSWTEERFLAPDDVLWNSTGTGTIGRAALFKGLQTADRAVVDSHVTILRTNGAVTGTFLHRFIQSPGVQAAIVDMQSGTTNQVELNRAGIIATTLPLPPLAEQKRIVAKLEALNAKSARARTELTRIETLVSRYKQAVLSKAFSGALTSTQFAQPDGNRSASHPAHWKQMQLGEIADIKSGITLGKKRRPDEPLLELPYLRVANVQRGWLDLREIKTIKVTAKEANALLLREGDVLMNEGGDRDKLGRGWVWDGQIHDCIHQNHVFRVRLASGAVPPRFLSYYANEFGQKHFFDEGKQTTNLASISKSKLSAMNVPVPPFEEATEIVRRIESAFAKIDRLAAEAKRALALVGRLDEAVLAKAFRGELVPQDENDEPATTLLARIRASRDAAPKVKRGRGRKA
ncbi:restriction endonuclease subunit S [Pannonibacter sp. Q-1]